MPIKKPKVFISYAREDQSKALKLYECLEQANCDPWIDTRKLLPGQRWKPAIKQAIKDCDFFLACLSKKSVKKIGFIQTELKEGYETLRQYLHSNIYLIPVRLEACDIPEELQEYNYVDLFKAEGFTQIFNSIKVEWECRGMKFPEPETDEDGRWNWWGYAWNENETNISRTETSHTKESPEASLCSCGGTLEFVGNRRDPIHCIANVFRCKRCGEETYVTAEGVD